ncbi:hypothetical protein NMY22_g4319 [Coprinellus aureogranulatus]|nr:hypothetical protein NMY22_g4319 [Coprinellus aureogranulatus]
MSSPQPPSSTHHSRVNQKLNHVLLEHRIPYLELDSFIAYRMSFLTSGWMRSEDEHKRIGVAHNRRPANPVIAVHRHTQSRTIIRVKTNCEMNHVPLEHRTPQTRDASDHDEVTPTLVSNLEFSMETRSLLETDYASSPNGYGKKLEQRTALLKAEILALENRRNALVFINQLPPEILSAIFDIVKTHAKRRSYHRRFSWMSVSFVCRHWRAVALDSTSLWTPVDFENPAIAELMLSRSKNVLLEISFNSRVNTKNCKETQCKALSQTQRLLSLDVTVDSASFSDVFTTCIGPAPHLTKLAIQGEYQGTAKLPERFFEGKSSALENLKLGGFDFVTGWEHLPFTASLRTLHLVASRQGPRLSLQSFLEAMQPLLSLNQLTLEDVLPRTGLQSLVAERGHQPTFPNVVQLTLTEPLEAAVDFMGSFRFPKCSKFLLFLKSETASMDFLSRLFSGLESSIKNYSHSSLAPSSSDVFLRAVDITNAHEHNHGNYTFTFQREQIGGKSSDVSVLVDLDRHALRAEELLKMVYRQVNMSRLQLLELSACGEISESHWKTVFVHLADLRVIRFRNSSFSKFVDVLKQDPALPKRLSKSGQLNVAPAPTYFCALTIIEFSQARFQKLVVSQLGQCLKRRPTSWPAIQLRIERSNFSAQHAEILEKAASDVQVTWDARPAAQTLG